MKTAKPHNSYTKDPTELKAVDTQASFPKIEEGVLGFWKKNKIFQKSLKQNQGQKPFVFLEGPPTANGKPGIHHVLSRAYKDLFLRYKSMQGFDVQRKAGWDTHGLPVEIQVEKELGISGKAQIETLKSDKSSSIEYFNQKAKESVWSYKKDWEQFTDRIGFWLDLDHPYVTYENSYIETLWWIIKQIWDKDLFYEDYKVVLHCPRCETSLSSHEVAQGYQDVQDISVYAKFKLKTKDNTYILAWTTTPWTLPGNVALAINPNEDYVTVQLVGSKDRLILAKSRLSILVEPYTVIENYKGKALVGQEYEPLYPVKYDKKSHFVVPADFVSMKDGTGVVHTAVMYGEDDYLLGQKLDLPKKHTVDESGRFTDEVGKWAGKFVHDTNKEIAEELKERALLYKSEQITHSYPFCWRCDTKLIYYAKSTWYIAVSKLRDELIAQNKKINWIPAHLQDGRFGEWLREVKDWAFARERYWGTPLPIWRCTNSDCRHTDCIGSIGELTEKSKKPATKVILMRHGDSEHNQARVYSGSVDDQYRLTKLGVEQISKLSGEIVKKYKIDKIFASDFIRCKETAQIISGATRVEIESDKRLREINFGDLNGKLVGHDGFYRKNYYLDPFPNGESIHDVQVRLQPFMRDIRTGYEGKTVVIVTHEDALKALAVSFGMVAKDFVAEFAFPTGTIHEVLLPEIDDLHRPFVDNIVLQCSECGSDMRRIEEVADVWFDSGSAPFAQWHYPFENKQKIDDGSTYPADYISEAIDQTRGWFYTLLAVATLLSRDAPYKNVISQGHIRDKQGKKMSKSRGNAIEPSKIIDKYGVDSLRWYFYTVNQPGEYKNFDERAVEQVLKKDFLILWNVYSFLITYSKASSLQLSYLTKPRPDHILDKWLHSAFNLLAKQTTEDLDKYDVTSASRRISVFINQLSTWYLKNSRARISEDKEAASHLYTVLIDLCKLIAPFAPFLVDEIYQNLRTKDMSESIHLSKYPEAQGSLLDDKLITNVEYVRGIISNVLSIRAAKAIKIRQPLQDVTIYIAEPESLDSSLLEIVKKEINVLKIKVQKSKNTEQDGQIDLNLDISPKLREQGTINEIVRTIQVLRKSAELVPQDKAQVLYWTKSAGLSKTIQDHTISIQERTGSVLRLDTANSTNETGKELTIAEERIYLSINQS